MYLLRGAGNNSGDYKLAMDRFWFVLSWLCVTVDNISAMCATAGRWAQTIEGLTYFQDLSEFIYVMSASKRLGYFTCPSKHRYMYGITLFIVFR